MDLCCSEHRANFSGTCLISVLLLGGEMILQSPHSPHAEDRTILFKEASESAREVGIGLLFWSKSAKATRALSSKFASIGIAYSQDQSQYAWIETNSKRRWNRSLWFKGGLFRLISGAKVGDFISSLSATFKSTGDFPPAQLLFNQTYLYIKRVACTVTEN